MELTLTEDNLHTLGKSIAERLGAPFGSTLEISDQDDGSLRIWAPRKKLSIHEVRRGMREVLGDVRIADAPVEEIQAAIATAYAEHGERGLQ